MTLSSVFGICLATPADESDQQQGQTQSKLEKMLRSIKTPRFPKMVELMLHKLKQDKSNAPKVDDAPKQIQKPRAHDATRKQDLIKKSEQERFKLKDFLFYARNT